MYRLKLKKLRYKQGLSLGELSNMTDISRSTLSDIENQKSSPTLTTINKLAQVLGPGILVWKEGRK